MAAGIGARAGGDAQDPGTGRPRLHGPATGYILAMVGGRQFSRSDQFNRATQARVQPGSAFKPLYYSAAIDSRKFTPATMILDAPVVFTNADGTLYEPLNYKGEWHGRVLLRDALAESMNVPSLKVLDGIGFDAAIQRASRLLGRHGSGRDRPAVPPVLPPRPGHHLRLSPGNGARVLRVRERRARGCSPSPSATSRTATERSSWSPQRRHWRGKAARAMRPRS